MKGDHRGCLQTVGRGERREINQPLSISIFPTQRGGRRLDGEVLEKRRERIFLAEAKVEGHKRSFECKKPKKKPRGGGGGVTGLPSSFVCQEGKQSGPREVSGEGGKRACQVEKDSKRGAREKMADRNNNHGQVELGTAKW